MKRAAQFNLILLALVSFSCGEVRRLEAEGLWLADDELLKRFNNATIDGRYADGRAFTESYRLDGSLNYAEAGGATLGGHWSVRSGTFCTIYTGDAAGGCYRVSRAGPNCFEFYFVARTEESAPGPADGKPRWTARGSVQGEPTACHDAPMI